MAKKKKKPLLDPQPRKRRPKYVMPVPNDDLDAYGWSLKNVRHPAVDDKTIGGRPVCQIRPEGDDLKRYGTDVQFACPEYLERHLDAAAGVAKALESARAAGYTPEALGKITAAVQKTFDDQVLVDIAERFYKIAPMVAQFYAARQAHRDMFGNRQDED